MTVASNGAPHVSSTLPLPPTKSQTLNMLRRAAIEARRAKTARAVKLAYLDELNARANRNLKSLAAALGVTL
jgi:hypothetical protein